MIIGELNRNELTSNFENSTTLSRAGVILRLNPSGTPVTTNPFYNGTRPLSDIYAYGIRNKEAPERFAGIPHPGTFIVDQSGIILAKLFRESWAPVCGAA